MKFHSFLEFSHPTYQKTLPLRDRAPQSSYTRPGWTHSTRSQHISTRWSDHDKTTKPTDSCMSFLFDTLNLRTDKQISCQEVFPRIVRGKLYIHKYFCICICVDWRCLWALSSYQESWTFKPFGRMRTWPKSWKFFDLESMNQKKSEISSGLAYTLLQMFI